jgi:hypothetical protein
LVVVVLGGWACGVAAWALVAAVATGAAVGRGNVTAMAAAPTMLAAPTPTVAAERRASPCLRACFWSMR